jgi:hypothetical protein
LTADRTVFEGRAGAADGSVAPVDPVCLDVAFSGGQTLPALGATAGEHATAADRGAARPETMAALADEIAGLKRALHGKPTFNSDLMPASDRQAV